MDILDDRECTGCGEPLTQMSMSGCCRECLVRSIKPTRRPQSHPEPLSIETTTGVALTMFEAMRELSVSRKTLIELIDSGILTAYVDNHKNYCFLQADIDKLKERMIS